ncbi:MAG: hypothetical protein COX80_03375 [Candidatus Magasanikbacteria bacterium CG_4_10_14_0_2_um_filter_33_14]|uniref:3D domain-containing protein n=1 Tax=Candidatus Magasanikbacteria bacterium CG_4_10_14_0_2_um_filter_33_14 TaxID=1974636 RepID=A0A2M7VA49_9BACT|nr:MAG: hypothetical protein COX80_03375 [Candidatus Magasanikbacteria bacterium CG_4_10_14_0_2_um_filter_33_14]
MKFSFKKVLSRQVFEVSISFVIVISFFTSTLLPQVVDAQTGFFANLSGIFSKDDISEEILENSALFPDLEDAEPRKIVYSVMTAYSSEAAQTDDSPCIPADYKYNLCEHYEQEGEQNSIAANFLPMGTKVRFPDLYGDKIFVVRDRMNARYGYGRGDIWMPTKAEAISFGVKRVKMEIFYR